MIDRTMYFSLLTFVFLVQSVAAQNTDISFSFNTSDGLVYFLVIFFFIFNFGTPIVRWIFANYLLPLVDRASKEFKKISKRVSDRLSDAGRTVSQQIRA
jgi:hypothetical protein